MGRRRKGERCNGPYQRQQGSRIDWYVYILSPDGKRRYRYFAREKDALAYKQAVEAELVTEALTVEYAISQFLGDKSAEGCRRGTLGTYQYALGKFFDEDLPLWALTEAWCRKRYERLRKEVANDTHRNYLAQAKTFLRWCVAKHWLPANPAELVRGVGRRRRGKRQLTIAELEVWDQKAHELARQGDRGAIAALFALWLGERAFEIVCARVRDVSARQRPGDTIQIPDSKSEAGIRVLEVAEPLSVYVAALCAEQPFDAFLFPSELSGSGHYGRDWPRKQVRRICELAGVTLVCAHSMRGAHATLGGTMGATSQLLAAALGHANPMVTEQHYAKPGVFEAERRRKALKILKGGR